MKQDEKVLHNLLRTAQMGQSGIKAVLPMAQGPGIQQALKRQKKEYASLEKEIQDAAARMAYSFPPSLGITETMSAMMSRGQLLFGDRDSKIAGMMIQGNSRGVIQALRDLQGNRLDPTVAGLTRKMLETERNNMRSMEIYL